MRAHFKRNFCAQWDEGDEMDRLRAIEVFVTVVEENSFSAAARKMNISPSSVSRIVQDLEADLKILLLKRTTRKFTLTNTGRSYFEDCKKIIQNLSDAEMTARASYNLPVGQLKVSAPEMFGAVYVTPIIAEFLSKYPEISISAVFNDRVEDIVDKNIDIAIRIGELGDSGLMAKKIASVSWIICGSPSYFDKKGVPKSTHDLLNHELIDLVIDYKHYNWKFKGDQALLPQNRLTVNSVLAAKRAALSGWGIVQVLSYQISEELNEGTLVEVLSSERPAPVPVNIVHSEGRNASAKIRLFSEFMASKIRTSKGL